MLQELGASSNDRHSLAHREAPRLRLDVWEKGNISIVQLEEKLRGAARQALADAVMELRLLPASLCTEDMSPGTWGPENVTDPGNMIFQVIVQKWGSGKTSQRPHLKYTLTAVYYLPSARRYAGRNVCMFRVTHLGKYPQELTSHKFMQACTINRISLTE